MNNNLSKIAEVIKQARSILITAHVFPDGDSIGSVLGLGLALESFGKKVSMVMQDKVPQMYLFLKGSEKIITPQEISAQPDLIVFLDCGDISRAGEDWIDSLVRDRTVINIDHHVSNEYFGTLNYVDAHAAATAEIIYSLLSELDCSLTKEVASALYTGIVMDTGSSIPEYHSGTLKIAASLLENGVDLSAIGSISKQVYKKPSADCCRH